MVVKTILFDELDEADQNRDVNDIDTSEVGHHFLLVFIIRNHAI